MPKKKFIINVFCGKDDLCYLIGKIFSKDQYEVRCANTLKLKNLTSVSTECDCVIIDKGIEKDSLDEIQNKFKGVPAVYLPSLDNSNNNNGINTTYISEPLKLSELREAVSNLLIK
jgi:hypothetical protein